MSFAHLKDGVNVAGIKPELLDGLLKLAVVFSRFNLAFVVTALTDGVHHVGSLHYTGYAADIRSRHIPPEQMKTVLLAIKEALGSSWDCINEVDHFHCEYDPQHDGGKTLI